ncbi:arginyl-tRNA synthetase [Schizopora paradoxa]|uniref:arginine--tRNA ligase n=1 Tax=Schizopora paradoxa TaxID=27342 RepID=A0A0H2R759_9AGAM|nr:arginyl-tRNA synthetase [Schizopora paradoxa]
MASTLPPLPHVEGTDSSRCVLDAFRISAATRISKSLGISLADAFAGVDLGKKGNDFTVAIPRFRQKTKPAELVEKIVSEFTPDEYIDRVSSDGSFVHFGCKSLPLTRHVLDQIHAKTQAAGNKQSESYGSNVSGKGKKVIVEYSSPNIAKPFHAGHLRSTIIGAFLSNLYTANGWDVTRMNYFGDWGKQYGLLAVGFERYGSEEKLEANPIMHLFEVYVKINADMKKEKEDGVPEVTDEKAKEVFKAMEDGDEKILGLWKRFRDLSLKSYEKLYTRLNVGFDVYAGESLVEPAQIDNAFSILKEKNLLTTKTKDESRPDWDKKRAQMKGGAPVPAPVQESVDDDDNDQSGLALAVDLEKFKLGKPVIQKSDGTTTYIVRDIAGAIQRYEKYHFDKMIYVVGDQQDQHLKMFFKVLSMMGVPFADKLEHINFGKVAGMSTRKGEVKFLEDILDAAKEAMMAQMKSNDEKFKLIEDPEETSDQIGMTCVKIQDMQSTRRTAYEFNLTRMTSFEGDTGAYLQYAHVRLCSIVRKVAPVIVLRTDPSQINLELLTEPKAREIVYLLATYPDTVKTALRNQEPSTIVSYCFKLSHLISSAWEILIVMGQEQELAQARLYLYTCARDVLSSAMRLLTLTPLERM